MEPRLLCGLAVDFKMNSAILEFEIDDSTHCSKTIAFSDRENSDHLEICTRRTESFVLRTNK